MVTDLGAFLLFHLGPDLDTSVEFPSRSGLVRGDRTFLSEPLCDDPVSREVEAFDQVCGGGLGPAAGEVEVELTVSVRVGMPLDDHLLVGELLQRFDRFLERDLRFVAEIGASRGERVAGQPQRQDAPAIDTEHLPRRRTARAVPVSELELVVVDRAWNDQITAVRAPVPGDRLRRKAVTLKGAERFTLITQDLQRPSADVPVGISEQIEADGRFELGRADPHEVVQILDHELHITRGKMQHLAVEQGGHRFDVSDQIGRLLLRRTRHRHTATCRPADRLGLTFDHDAEVGLRDQPRRDPEDVARIGHDGRAGGEAVPVELHHPLARDDRREVVPPVIVGQRVGSIVEGDHRARHPRLVRVLPAVAIGVLEHLTDQDREIESRIQLNVDHRARGVTDRHGRLVGRGPVGVLAGEDAASDPQDIVDFDALGGRKIERAQCDRPDAGGGKRGDDVIARSKLPIEPRPHQAHRSGVDLESGRDQVAHGHADERCATHVLGRHDVIGQPADRDLPVGG